MATSTWKPVCRPSVKIKTAFVALAAVLLVGFPFQATARWTTVLSEKQKHCYKTIPNDTKGCDFNCPPNSCVKNQIKCVRNFNDCICKTGYYKPSANKYPVFGQYHRTGRSRGSGGGNGDWGDGPSMRDRMIDLHFGAAGQCLRVKRTNIIGKVRQ